MAEFPSIRVDAGYRVVTEEKLLKGGQSVKGAAVHLRQIVAVQVAAGDKRQINTVYLQSFEALLFLPYRAFILARSQKAPSVSLLMLFLCNLRTSRLDKPWKVRPST